LDLSYSLLDLDRHGETGTGQTVDISSSALRFLAERPLAIGLQVEVAISWPPRLHGNTPLQLVVTGTVIRSSGGETVVVFEKHTFKTRRTGATLVPIR
jgi:hypothetical protein